MTDKLEEVAPFGGKSRNAKIRDSMVLVVKLQSRNYIEKIKFLKIFSNVTYESCLNSAFWISYEIHLIFS